MAKADRAEAQQAGDADAIAADEFADVADLSYEQARDELIAIVAQLEGGQSGLEESMRLWRRGEGLFLLQQAEIDIQFGMDINIWLAPWDDSWMSTFEPPWAGD